MLLIIFSICVKIVVYFMHIFVVTISELNIQQSNVVARVWSQESLIYTASNLAF